MPDPIEENQPAAQNSWAEFADESLMAMRLCDLGLSLSGTPVEGHIRQVLTELRSRGLKFRPHFWLSTEWFTPDGVPGIAVPFYLAHPRLTELERKIMLLAEGESAESCLKIIRHEVGHAIDNGYRLHKRRDYRKVFGSWSKSYPEFYQPKPHSRRYVFHIEDWYAQSHPAEDFAETFAVWLTPGMDWERKYCNWPALKKLRYVDALMKELAGQPPTVRSRRRTEPVEKLTLTLQAHYDAKRRRYGTDLPDFFDRDLRKLFSDSPEYASNESAARFLQRMRRQTRRIVARWTDAYQYTIDQVLKQMIDRCRKLNLRLTRTQPHTEIEATVLLTVKTMNYIHDGRHRMML
ncbi:MAG: putative zinc-binding metallopeptidase [Phycisphaerae bacterium]|nr:putative zinc-binding metallopeptidase [Phycisphaerae bacterium]